MTEAIAICAVIFALAMFGFHIYESAAWRSERSELLNRVMARSYQEFVYQAPVDSETPQLTTDAAEQAWYAAQQRETLTEAS